MSTIVVVQKDDAIAIAADSLTKYGNLKVPKSFHPDGKSKIIKFEDTYIGTVGASVHLDVLRSIFQKYPDKICFNSREDIFETYVRIHPILKNEYFINPASTKDDDYESSQIEAVLANPRGIFAMYTWRTTPQYDRFFAIGSGRDYALGAMQAVYESLPADQIAEVGIKVACDFDDGSGLPIEMYRLQRKTSSSGAGLGERFRSLLKP